MELGPRQVDAAEAVGAVHVERLLRQGRVGGGEPQPREPRRIEQADERLQVGRGLFGGHVAPRRRHRQHFQPWIEQGHDQRHGIVYSRIDVENHLAGHGQGVSEGGVV